MKKKYSVIPLLEKKSKFFCPAKWTELFLYLNPFHKEFSKCGYFYGDESISIKELSNAVYGSLFNIKNSKALNKLKFYLENQHSINFSKHEFLKFNFTIENDEFIEFARSYALSIFTLIVFAHA